VKERVQITTGSGVEFAPQLSVKRLMALGRRRANFPLLVHDLPPTATVDGVLGLDFFRDQRLIVDFRKALSSWIDGIERGSLTESIRILMKATIYWIPAAFSGRLGIVPRPRGGDWLEEEISAWRAAGVDVVVSALTAAEVEEFSLSQEERECGNNGIEYFSFPIEDREVPTTLLDTVKLVSSLEARLNAGKSVVIHCRQGIGRSSLLAACVLNAGGTTAEEALQAIGLARGCPVPETHEQRDWIMEFGRDLVIASKK
jgi:protein-tyrosine phosphatase